MREIKFRAWYGGKIGMRTPEFNGNINDIFSDGAGIYMQYTGLKDVNGREVYEGDILKRIVTIVVYGSGFPPENVDDIQIVEWRECYAGFYIGERDLFAELHATVDFYTRCRCTKFEVIGNIHEHPHLLEVSE